MQSADLLVTSEIVRSPRVVQLEGLFDVPPSKRTELRWSVNLPLDAQPWNIGLIVGPSGSGKTTVARGLFGDVLVRQFEWPEDRSIVDGFSSDLSVKDVVELLSSVGFSSPPAWLRPFRVLSNGEQFRVIMARLLAEMPELAVVDEFTSVVDRQVAQVGSAAIARTVRRRRQKLIAVTCHYDVVEWLQPDWIYQPGLNDFAWRSLQRRPGIELEVCRVHHSAWRLFAHHHYLNPECPKSARCFVGLYRNEPICFAAVMPIVGRAAPGWRISRTVTLPDFQGVGLGTRFTDLIASLHAPRVFLTTSHPGMIAALNHSHNWKMIRKPGLTRSDSGRPAIKHAIDRLTASFRYCGERRLMPASSLRVGVNNPRRPRIGIGRRICASDSIQAIVPEAHQGESE